MAEYGINGTTLNLEHLVLKANNAATWSADYVLMAGEIGIELDTKKYKLGDGETKWSELAYYSNPVTDSLVEGLTAKVSANESAISALQGKDTEHESRMTTIEAKDTEQDGKISTLESNDTAQDGKISALEAKDTEHESRMTTIESKDTAQDGRLDALEGITTLSANPFRE